MVSECRGVGLLWREATMHEPRCTSVIAKSYSAPMFILSPHDILATAALVDIAVNAQRRRVSYKHLRLRHGLSSRSLESRLQGLVRSGILRSIRGPTGGYELARDWHRISVEDILRGMGARQIDHQSLRKSAIVRSAVGPVFEQAENAYFERAASAREYTDSASARA
jgi:Rrf2 family protein